MKPASVRIHRNVWDNWYGYVGTRRVKDFGLDERAAHAWWYAEKAEQARIASTKTRSTRRTIAQNSNS